MILIEIYNHFTWSFFNIPCIFKNLFHPSPRVCVKLKILSNPIKFILSGLSEYDIYLFMSGMTTIAWFNVKPLILSSFSKSF